MDTERIKFLKSLSILDSKDEKEYDDITRLASTICNTPIALISFIDEDRQWFKSSYGFNKKETSLDVSFCKHAIKEDKPIFEIKNATIDSRFKNNPLVTGEDKFIFYAGAKLISKKGHTLGTVCVIDHKKRSLSQEQKDSLKMLANQVMKLLELRKANLFLEQEKEQFQRFTELSCLIVYKYSKDRKNIYHNDRVKDILGYSPEDFKENPTLWTDLIHENDIQRVEEAFKNIHKNEQIDIKYRMRKKSGEIIWIHDRSTSIHSQEGNFIVEGLADDITNEVKTKQDYISLNNKYKIAVEASKDDVWEWDLKTGEVFYSSTWFEKLGYSKSDLNNHIEGLFKIIHPDDLPRVKEKLEEVKQDKNARSSTDYRIKSKEGKYYWFTTRGSAIKNKDGIVTHVAGSTSNIHKRKLIEEENKQVRIQLQKILDLIPSYIYAKDEEGKFLMVNKAAADVFGLSPKNIIGKDPTSTNTPKELLLNYRSADQKVIQNNRKLFIPEIQILKKDNTLGWFQTIKMPYKHPGQSKNGVLCVSTEITERKKIEEELTYIKDFLEQSNKMAKVGAWELDVTTNELRWSKSTKEIHEVDDDYNIELKQAINFFRKGKNRKKIAKLVENSIKTGESYDTELEIITARGNSKWVRAIGTVKKNKGKVKKLYGTVQDITDQRNNIQELIDTQQKLKSIFNEIESVVWSIKLPSYKLMFITPSIEKIYGVSVEKWEKDPNIWKKFVHPDDIDQILNSRELLNLKGEYDVEYRIIDANNNLKWIRNRAKYIYNQNGSKVRLDGFITDITASKNAELDLLKINEITQLQNDRLKNFAYIVSHNLRSHSANMLSLIDLFKIEFKEFENNQMLNMLHDASQNLMETIEHLSEVALLNVKTSKENKPLNINKFVSKILKSNLLHAEEKDIEIINNAKSYLIMGLDSYVESIISNLITNAIKYSDQQKNSYIRIETKETADYLKFSVEDNGKGINLEKYSDRIFKMYQKFHRNKDARGIGLFLTKSQVEAIGGKIEVVSEEGVGSTFTVYFKKP